MFTQISSLNTNKQYNISYVLMLALNILTAVTRDGLDLINTDVILMQKWFGVRN